MLPSTQLQGLLTDSDLTEEESLIASDDPKEFGRWLNRAFYLKANRRTKKHEIVELTAVLYDELGLGGYNKESKQAALNCVLSNLFLGSWFNVPVMFSRRNGSYSMPKRYHYEFFTRRNILQIIDALEEADLIVTVAGRQDLGKVSRMWAADELLDRLEALTLRDIERIPPKDPVIMTRRIKRGNRYVNEPTDYRDNAQTRRMRRFLYRYNSLLAETCIEIDLPAKAYRNLSKKALLLFIAKANGVRLDRDAIKLLETLSRSDLKFLINERDILYPIPTHTFTGTISLFSQGLHRVFNRQSWKLGGRFYGSEVQILPKELRQFLTLNGEATIEPDFSAMHLRMLYHERGLGDPGGDLYDFGADRELNKLASLIVINCEPEHDEVRAIAAAFRDNEELRSKHGDEIMKHDFVRQLIADFKAAHPDIAQDFFSGCGLRLQNKDSMIMADILEYFADREVPAIPVHDSVIVPESLEEEAKMVMREMYRRHMNGSSPVVI